MGIDRHEWERRNAKPGRGTAAVTRESDDPAPFAPDAALGPNTIPLQPEIKVESETHRKPTRRAAKN